MIVSRYRTLVNKQLRSREASHMTAAIEVPELVRTTALGHGRAGEAWLRELPAVVRAIERRWGLTVGAPYSGGTASYVADAMLADGTIAVVKVALRASEADAVAFDRAVFALEIAGGRGCVRALAHDAELGVLLLERLGRNLDSLQLPAARQLEIICETVSQMWVPVPSDARLPSGAEKAAWLAELITSTWHELGRPCAARTVDMALAFAAEREQAFDPAAAVLVHGDAHSWNTLEAGDGAFKLVDVEGVVSEPAQDLAVPMRELNDELLAGDALRLGRERARVLGDLTGADAEAIWQWGFVERVSTGLYSLSLGQGLGQPFLDIADRWSGAVP
jgi:streptomycin 6-kinase